ANRQFVRNIEDSQGWLDTTESALASITDYVNRAHDLLVRAASDTSDPTSRIAIAAEIDQIIQGIKESANATYGDRYVLSGTATTRGGAGTCRRSRAGSTRCSKCAPATAR